MLFNHVPAEELRADLDLQFSKMCINRQYGFGDQSGRRQRCGWRIISHKDGTGALGGAGLQSATALLLSPDDCLSVGYMGYDTGCWALQMFASATAGALLRSCDCDKQPKAIPMLLLPR
jgi:hypothetical protein